jgi:DNA mismatch repair protein MutS2
VGDRVETEGRGISGEVVALKGDRARVRRGALTFEVPAALLQKTAVGPSRTVKVEGPDAVAQPAELNLVGLRVREALYKLDAFLDKALLAGHPLVRIVHGAGSGALRRAVREHLAASPYCRSCSDGGVEEGGAAVTVAELG